MYDRLALFSDRKGAKTDHIVKRIVLEIKTDLNC